MPTDAGQPKKRPSPKAEEAFRRYVALGPSRSLRKLAADLVQQKQYKSDTTALNALNRWSTENHWQQRLASAASEASERMLQDAAELDADTFLQSSRRLNSDIRNESETETVIRIRESVRKPASRSSTSVDVNVNVSVELQQAVDRIAEEDGLTETEKRELMSSVERHLAKSGA